MSDQQLLSVKEYKSAETYKTQLKEQLMEAIGTAQAVVLLKPTPKGERRKRLMNPSRPAGPGNPEFTYVEHAYVSETLDMAMMMNWDLVVTKSERIGEEAFVEGYIEARFKNKMVIKRFGYGGAVKRANANQSWGDVFKAAASDLLKNCASRMGIARDLYRSEEKKIDTAVPAVYTQGPTPITADSGRAATPEQFRAIATIMGVEEVPEELKAMTFVQAAQKIKDLTAKKGSK